MKWILAWDPGNLKSAYVLMNENLRPVSFVRAQNEVAFFLANRAMSEHVKPDDTVTVAIEMIASYGMPVGREVFDTCIWIGRLLERYQEKPVHMIYRMDEKMCICHSPKATDSTIRQALVDRFAPGQPNYGKGTKKEPGWFYGFSKDVWQAYAVGVTCAELEEGK